MYLLLCSQLSKRLPGIADPPTVSQVEESFKKFDRDASGDLDYNEYKGFVVQWYAVTPAVPCDLNMAILRGR